MASTLGERIGPPAAKLYAVDPVEVATTSASAAYRMNSSPWRLMEMAAIPWPGTRTRAMSLNARHSRPSGRRVRTAMRASVVKRPLSMRSSAAARSSTSISARKPSRPRLTPSTGVAEPESSRMARSMVPSPPRLTIRPARATRSSAGTATALQAMRPTSSGSPSTSVRCVRAQWTTDSMTGPGLRLGCRIRPIDPI